MVFSFILLEPGSNIRLLHVIQHVSTNIRIYFVILWKQFKTEIMREILFRGKRSENGKWKEGDLIQYVIYTSIRANVTEEEGVPCFMEFIVIPETVGQFTGLTDKDGVKIFEDDLRKDPDGIIFRIYSVPGGFCIKEPFWRNDTNDLDGTDELICEPLSDLQNRDWVCNSTTHAGNIHDQNYNY